MIIGHQKILSFFNQAIAAGNLGHAYLFVGPANVGKETVARKIAAGIFGVEEKRLNFQPDWFVLKQVMDEKTNKTKKDISIDQMRDCQKFMAEFSFLGGYKIVLIKPAENMSLAAANALLKTLEEPKRKTILFLLAINERKLPITIRSRCQAVYFSPVSIAEIEIALQDRGLLAKEAKEMAILSRGLPGLALNWLSDQGGYEKYQKELHRFISLFNQPFYDKIKRVEDLFGDKTDHVVARENLENVLGVWQMVLRDKLLANQNGLSGGVAVKIYNSIQLARIRLRENIHPRLLVEEILLAMP
jgi:DNA polymerase-3 subunit delta'